MKTHTSSSSLNVCKFNLCLCCKILDQALLQPYPSELVFQNFAPSQTYKLPLRFINNDKVCE